MSKIVIIAPGILPIPATKGGAVETGIEQLIKENELHSGNKFEVFSCFDEEAKEEAKKIKNTDFIFYKFKLIDKIEMICLKCANKVISLMKIKRNFNIYPRFVRFICKNLKSSEYDAILIKNSIRFVTPISRITDKPIILQLHNDFLNSETPGGEDIVSKCYKIVANSEYIKKRICTISNVSPEKVYVNMNCLDNSSFEFPSEQQKNEIITRFNIDIHKKNIIYVGRIAKVKGVKELLLALKNIKDNDKWHLLIVGGKWFSSNYKDKYYRELSSISKDFKEKISFLGYVKHEDIKTLYAISSVAVVPSIWEEPAGRVVLEAEAMKIPVVAANSGGIPEYVNEKSAIIIERDKLFIDNISKGIEELINDTDKAALMGIAGLKYAQLFTAERYYTEILKIIEEKNEKQ